MSAAQSIVVVEDNDEDYETVVEAARRTGIPHRLHRATSGGECLHILQASLQNRSHLPALVLLDKKTLPILIAQLRSADFLKFDMGKVYMMVAIAILPVIIVYLLLSKFIVRGVALGGVKG